MKKLGVSEVCVARVLVWGLDYTVPRLSSSGALGNLGYTVFPIKVHSPHLLSPLLLRTVCICMYYSTSVHVILDRSCRPVASVVPKPPL